MTEVGAVIGPLQTKLETQKFSLSLDPQFDDGRKKVEAIGFVRAKNAKNVAIITEYAYQAGAGVVPMGSLTSAVNAFKTNDPGKQHGITEWVGIQMDPKGQLSELSNLGIDTDTFEVIPILEGRARILKSNNPNVPHRVQSWAGVTPAELDEALVKNLGRGYSTGLDLTTRDQAQLAAVVATGGQGPSRRDATSTLESVIIVNGEGQLVHLQGDEAKKQVGLGGMAGAITEVDLRVNRELPNECGLFIPLPGTLQEGVTKGFPKLMSGLAPFIHSKPIPSDDGGQLMTAPQSGKVLIKGFEIVTRQDLQLVYESLQAGNPVKGCVGSILCFMRDNRCEVGLMINGRTLLDREKFENYLCKLYEESEEDANESDSELDFISALSLLIKQGVLHSDLEGIIPFFDEHMPGYREARERVAVVARESQKEGPTKSTDLNLCINTSNQTELEQAYQAIWEIYSKYIQDADGRDAQIFLYGHNSPGTSEGGGVDAHIRVTFPLKEKDHQSRAAENIAWLTARQGAMYEELIALHGTHGIEVRCGEKGLMNARYATWLEETNPKKAEEILKYMWQHGGPTFAARNEHFRLHAYPPRLNEGGILNYFAPDPIMEHDAPLLQRVSKSILLWCQNSHRSPEAQKIFGEVLGLFRDWLGLTFDERIFYAETPQKALHVALVSLTDYKNGGKVLDLREGQSIPKSLDGIATIVTSNPAQLDIPNLANTRKILVMTNAIPVSAETRQKADAIIYSAENFGTGGELGILITPSKTVQRARDLRKKGNNIDYVHALPELNKTPNSTIETPKMQVLAELGCLLAQRRSQTCTLDTQSETQQLEAQGKFLSLNVGPSQIHRGIIDHGTELNFEAQRLKAGSPEDRKTKVEEIKTKLRRYLGVPDDYEIFFGGSATQAMQQIVESLGLSHSIPVSMGAFGDRMGSIVQRFSPTGAKVRPVQMRWGTGPNSRINEVLGAIKTNQPRKLAGTTCGVFLTGTETSTGVECDVSTVSKGLHPDIFKIVDGTSEIGGVKRDFTNMDVYFGSAQKFLGVPSGLSIMIVSPRAMEQARKTKEQRDGANKPTTPAYRTFMDMQTEAETGDFHNLRGLLQLEIVLNNFKERGGIETLISETRAKLEAWETKISQPGDELLHVVEYLEDRSSVMLHILPVDRDTADIRRRVLVSANTELGNGYGPYKGETLRVYMSPHVPTDSVQKIATCFNKSVQDALERPRNRPFVSRGIPSV